jgi:RNase P subunit RPR2
MQAKHARCPKCQGQLYLEQDVGSQFRLPPEWTCLQCGWRRTYTPRELERTFAVAVVDEGSTPDGVAELTWSA